MSCLCQIIPNKVLKRLARDRAFSDGERKSFRDTAAVGARIRSLRVEAGRLSAINTAMGVVATLVPDKPAITVADCHHGQTLPGTPVADPGASDDAPIRNAFVETTAVAEFYRTAFGRNSLDAQGMTLGSSVHYGTNFNNAFWNGLRMTYGDGDGSIFVDFTGSPDVIAHELTHGVTQYTLQLDYADQAGGLNEHLSDVFGSMFRQWRAGQDVAAADWLIGKDIMGPAALARGFTCLRDMARPGAEHCLSPQPFHFDDYKDGMDPHDSSGIPNLAFCNAAKAIGGKSWEVAGKIWYQAMIDIKPTPKLKMKAFATKTRSLAKSMFAVDKAVAAAVDSGWKSVGL